MTAYNPHACPFCSHHLGPRRCIDDRKRPFKCSSCGHLVMRARTFSFSELGMPLISHLLGAVGIASFLLYLLTTVNWPGVVVIVGGVIVIRIMSNPILIARHAYRGGYVPATRQGQTEYFAALPWRIKPRPLTKSERDVTGGLSVVSKAQPGDLELKSER